VSKDIRSLLPVGARRANSVTQCQEIILESTPSELTPGINNPYIEFCNKFGFDPKIVKIRELMAHAGLMAGLSGNPTAQENLKNRLEGKVADKVEVVNPLAELTDDQLDRLENETKRIT
jgi:hypothetical protein